MTIEIVCECGKRLRVKSDWANQKVRCPECAQTIRVPSHSSDTVNTKDINQIDLRHLRPPSVSSSENNRDNVDRHSELAQESRHSEIKRLLERIDDSITELIRSKIEQRSPTRTPIGRCEYKVLTQKDKWFSGKFDPDKLEQALNAYAEQGWFVKGTATASIPGVIGGNREEIIIILERSDV